MKIKKIHSYLTNFSKLFLLAIGAITTYQMPSLASQSEVVPSEAKLTIAQAPSANASLSDGVYLYGQSSDRGKIGSEYLIFAVQKDRVVGVSYYPRSEFSCFTGTINSQQMSLSMVDPYTQTVHPYSIALQAGLSVASASEQVPNPVELIGYQRIDTIEANDRRMLNICLEQHQ